MINKNVVPLGGTIRVLLYFGAQLEAWFDTNEKAWEYMYSSSISSPFVVSERAHVLTLLVKDEELMAVVLVEPFQYDVMKHVYVSVDLEHDEELLWANNVHRNWPILKELNGFLTPYVLDGVVDSRTSEPLTINLFEEITKGLRNRIDALPRSLIEVDTELSYEAPVDFETFMEKQPGYISLSDVFDKEEEE